MPTRRKEKQAPYCTSMGSLGAAAPKPVFAYFCLAAKVGRARGHEISPGRHYLKEKVEPSQVGRRCVSVSPDGSFRPAPAPLRPSGQRMPASGRQPFCARAPGPGRSPLWWPLFSAAPGIPRYACPRRGPSRHSGAPPLWGGGGG